MKKFLRRLGVAAAVLVGLVLVVTAIGAFLPRDHVAVRQVAIDRPAEELWAVITDFGAASSWRPEIERCEQMPDVNGHEVWKETSDGMEIPYETAELVAPNHLVRRIADDELPFGGTWTIELSPSDSTNPQRTLVEITERGFVPNPLWRFFSVVVFGHTDNLDRYLTNLGKKFGQEIKVSSPAS